MRESDGRRAISRVLPVDGHYGTTTAARSGPQFIARLLARLMGPCLFSHDRRVLDRDARGQLVLVCPRCLDGHVVRLSPGGPW